MTEQTRVDPAPAPPAARLPAAAPAARPRGSRLAFLAVLVLTLGVLAWCGALVWALWLDLEPAQREAARALLEPRRAIVVLFVLLLPLAAAALLVPWLRGWPRAAERLRDEVAIVTAAHSAHRISPTGARPMRELAAAVDTLAQTHAALQREVDARIAQANARAAEEAQRLAALMSQLTQGVLVCNRDGRILLYNERALALLDAEAALEPGAGAARVGLGRPVQGVLDAAALAHAWDQVGRRLAQGSGPAVAHFVTRWRPAHDARAPGSGALLRVQMVPIRAEPGAASGGYVLLVDDITRSVEAGSRRDALLQRLTEGTRSALGNLRAAAQTLQQYPAMDAERRARFTAAIHDEAERLAQQLGQALHEGGDARGSAWPLEDVRAGDLLWALQRSLRSSGGVECELADESAATPWLEVDSHALVQMLAYLIGRLGSELKVDRVVMRLQHDGRFVRVDACWTGQPLEPASLHEWEDAALPLVAPGQGGARVQDVVTHHRAELWSLPDHETRHQRLCLQLDAARGAGDDAAAAAPRGRPIYYDFDLFHQAGQSAALDETALAELAYTVFDTETTGLRPSEGDEIIAIGALRIVNGKLLEHEHFDRLTRPRRPVRESAQAVHGITPQMLEGQPPLEQVLPAFARFAEGTVLVAHNAAFDMRFLELARERTGVRFDHPVLDTLLLSSVLQPGHRDDEHTLEQIAGRLGVAIVGRHTALGDAIVTGRVFLKLLPLLAERGIRTLGQAREASRRSVQARQTY